LSTIFFDTAIIGAPPKLVFRGSKNDFANPDSAFLNFSISQFLSFLISLPIITFTPPSHAGVAQRK
jgi:hypothetical protein